MRLTQQNTQRHRLYILLEDFQSAQWIGAGQSKGRRFSLDKISGRMKVPKTKFISVIAPTT